MFTGLIETQGAVIALEPNGAASRITIGPDDPSLVGELAIGESVSVNGVCLSVTAVGESTFEALAVEETIRRTNLGQLALSQRVNLERALRLDARLGGHIVQGHVDGVGAVAAIRPEGEGWWVTIEPPGALMKYVVEKGSICLDGISLTVANVAYARFSVALIPHTRANTTAGQWSAGTSLNIEVDIVAKYVERLTQWHSLGSTANPT